LTQYNGSKEKSFAELIVRQHHDISVESSLQRQQDKRQEFEHKTKNMFIHARKLVSVERRSDYKPHRTRTKPVQVDHGTGCTHVSINSVSYTSHNNEAPTYEL